MRLMPPCLVVALATGCFDSAPSLQGAEASAAGSAVDALAAGDGVLAAPDAGNAFGDASAPEDAGASAGQDAGGSGDSGPDASDGTGSDGTGSDGTGSDEEDGFEYRCEPLDVEACVTACESAGQRQCLKAWGPCIPPAEWCGNCTDDDCDGKINEGCPPNPACDLPDPPCPIAIIAHTPQGAVTVGTVVQLSAAGSVAPAGAIVAWTWSVQAPPGSGTGFVPNANSPDVALTMDVSGQYLVTLEVEDEDGTSQCSPAQQVVIVLPDPPLPPEVGCADGAREGFVDLEAWTHIAGCSGGWDQPGITPLEVQPTCNLQGGDDGPNPEGVGCSAPDLCADGWHVCEGWEEVAADSPTGCAGASPAGAPSKTLFFALRQRSDNGSACGGPDAGVNDVFGCGNLGTGLSPAQGCGPLDRVIASTQPNSCGFNEAEPPLGPWECAGGPQSHLGEGGLVTKKGCPNGSCSYDGNGVGSQDKGGVLCCRD